MRVGQTLAGNLADSGAFDNFIVPLQADTHYRIEALLDSLDDSVLTLFDPDGRKVAYNNDFSGDDFRDASYGSLIDYTAAASGPHTVKVAGYGSKTGTYRLRIGAGGSMPIQVGQTLTGNWAAKGTLDHFTVSLQASTHYRIEVLLDSLDDSVLTLFDPDGREVASNNNRNDASRTSHIDYTTAMSGTHTVKVAGFRDSTGSYRLRIGAGPFHTHTGRPNLGSPIARQGHARPLHGVPSGRHRLSRRGPAGFAGRPRPDAVRSRRQGSGIQRQPQRYFPCLRHRLHPSDIRHLHHWRGGFRQRPRIPID